MVTDRADRLGARDAGQSGGSLAYVYLLTSVAALGGLLFGYDTAVIAGAIKYIKLQFQLNDVQEGWAVSCVIVGCILGAALAGTLSDRLGRKRVLVLSAVFFAVSAVTSAIAQDLTQFAAARILGGFAVGAASMLSPLYIAEASPPRVRGRLVSLNQIAIISGMLVVSIVNWWIASPIDESWNVAAGWRWMLASETLPAALFLGCLFLVPESPRWLTKQGRESEALAVLGRVSGPERAAVEMAEIKDTIAEETGSVRDLFQPGIRMALIVALGLAILQQVTGINAVLYYAPKIFEASKVTPTQALLQTVALQAVNLLFTLVAIQIVDRGGRKPLLLVTSAAMGVSLVLLGGAFRLDLAPAWIFAFTLCYVASFGVAMGPVVWVVLSEVFPTRTRGRAMAIATVALWAANFLVTQTVPSMFEAERLGPPGTFWTYALMCLVAFVFVARFVPETKGKTLEEIERGWMGQCR
jgi:sugar porter (SP) family MFS transporter